MNWRKATLILIDLIGFLSFLCLVFAEPSPIGKIIAASAAIFMGYFLYNNLTHPHEHP